MKKFIITFFSILELIFLSIIVCDSETNKPLIPVSKLDGKKSTIRIEEKGKIILSNDINSKSLVSSSSRILYNQDGNEIEIITSLNEDLFKVVGKSLEAFPFDVEEWILIFKAKEFSSFRLEVNSRRMTYICSSKGCWNQNHGKFALGDIVIVRKTQLTVCLVESRSGPERWSFSVGELNLQLSGLIFIFFLCCLLLVAFIKKYFNTFKNRSYPVAFQDASIQTEIHESRLPTEDQSTTMIESSAVEMEYNSRFLQDFEILECLGRGGFGIVFKAQNSLNSCIYAVKRILLPQNYDDRQKMLREVRALAILDHRSIVRFYNAWQESPPKQWQERQDSVNPCLQGNGNSFTDSFSSDESIPVNMKSHSGSMSHTSSSIIFMTDDLSKTTAATRTDDSELLHDLNCKTVGAGKWMFKYPKNTESQTETTFENSSSSIVFDSIAYAEDDAHIFSKRKLQVKNSKIRNRYQCTPSKTEKSKQTSKGKTSSTTPDYGRMYLFIQMELCRDESLRDWLQTKVDRNRKEFLNIFKQILDAVIYIHAKHLIHRDLNPSNIFFSLDGVIKVGDFGLVTTNKVIEMSSSSHHFLNKSSIHTEDVGTQMYMAPEQMTSSTYTDKVDIFALGIILLELSNTFNTQMERICVLSNARTKGTFPKQFTENYPDEKKITARMLNKDANQRPSALQVLDFFNSLDI